MKQLLLLLAFVSVSYIATAQQAITVEKKGKGQPVIFLPGFSCPGSVWNESIDAMKEGFEIHRVTYAGFDGTEPIAMPWYNTLKAGLIEYIKKENLSGIYMVGHSMGGTLAIDIAATLPDICAKVMVVDGLPCMREIMMPGLPAEQLQYDSPYSKQMLEMNADQLKNVTDMMARNMTTDTAKAALISEWAQRADRETYVYGYIDLLKLDLREDLKKITCPVVVLSASWPNAELYKQNYEKQYANVANKEIKIAPSSRHFIMFDQPEWFYTELNDFLGK